MFLTHRLFYLFWAKHSYIDHEITICKNIKEDQDIKPPPCDLYWNTEDHASSKDNKPLLSAKISVKLTHVSNFKAVLDLLHRGVRALPSFIISLIYLCHSLFPWHLTPWPTETNSADVHVQWSLNLKNIFIREISYPKIACFYQSFETLILRPLIVHAEILLVTEKALWAMTVQTIV